MTSDEELVRELKRGSREALASLFGRHKDFVYRVALGFTGSREDAAEIVQETFLALLERAESLDTGRGRVTTWLFEVARRRAADLHRRRRTAHRRPMSVHSTGDDPERSAVDSERRAALHRAVAELPERPREVFVLRVGLGLSVEEASRLLGASPGAVRTALYDAHVRLRAILAEAEKGAHGVRHLSPSSE